MADVTTSSPPRRTSARSLAPAAPYAVLALALLFHAVCAFSTISKPGLQHDEMLFINAALGGHWSWREFIVKDVAGVPTMMMSYIGALKAWLFWPIFKVFGVSPTTIRGPLVLGAMVAIAGMFWLVRRPLGAWSAAALAVLLATDPVYTTMVKADWGPIALASFLRVGALLAYFAWLRTRSVRYLWLGFAALFLGVWNKLDFLSFVAALAITALVVHHRDIWAAVKDRLMAVGVAFAAFVAGMLVLYVEVIDPARDTPVAKSDKDFTGRIHQVWDLLTQTMNGSTLHGYMTGLPVAHATLFTALLVPSVLLAAACAAGYVVGASGGRLAAHPVLAERLRFTTFFFVLFVVMAAILTATPQVLGPHHIEALWPLPATLTACVLSVALALPRPQLPRVAAGIAVVGIAVLTLSQVRTSAEFRSDFASDRHWTPIWTTEIYSLAEAVNRAAPSIDSIVSTDWGFGTQVFALGNDATRRRYAGGWGSFAFGDDNTALGLVDPVFRGRATLVLYHAPGGEILPNTSERWQKVLKAIHPHRGTSQVWVGKADAAMIVDDRP